MKVWIVLVGCQSPLGFKWIPEKVFLSSESADKYVPEDGPDVDYDIVEMEVEA